MWLDLPDQSSGGGGVTEQRVLAESADRRNLQRYRQEEAIAGIILYRMHNGVLEYLLLKKVNQNDWSPPKGHLEPGEDSYDGAERETFEETGFGLGDYEALEQYPIYFEYKTQNQILKKVNLWAAKYLNHDKPLRLSPEHDEFQWLDYEATVAVVKRQYKEAVMAADLVIRTYESL